MAERGRGPGMMAPPTMGRLRAGITDTVLWPRSMSLAGSAHNPVEFPIGSHAPISGPRDEQLAWDAARGASAVRFLRLGARERRYFRGQSGRAVPRARGARQSVGPIVYSVDGKAAAAKAPRHQKSIYLCL